MSGNMRSNSSDSRGQRRNLRTQRERDRRLAMRHRWYAGGIATRDRGALIFTGVPRPPRRHDADSHADRDDGARAARGGAHAARDDSADRD